jgi:hypothetical protein
MSETYFIPSQEDMFFKMLNNLLSSCNNIVTELDFRKPSLSIFAVGRVDTPDILDSLLDALTNGTAELVDARVHGQDTPGEHEVVLSEVRCGPICSKLSNINYTITVCPFCGSLVGLTVYLGVVPARPGHVTALVAMCPQCGNTITSDLMDEIDEDLEDL